MIPMLRTLTLCAAGTLLTVAAPRAALAQPDLRSAGYLAANCANCHGTAGRSVTGAMPALAGVPKENIVKSLTDFRDGKRSATVMQQLAKGYSDEQIGLLAEFFSRQSAK